ncbi:hypothetical protein CEXT_484531 [Caerostris extrusa]|uniref:Uncharacterized protein n=1 Tax=Caerostris extrusa TaxID=172846 RepID=A0AAV4UYG6_CAEEX|nr:hypothetical protein CEXT_484531 [Caerostris extrusa]
MFERNLTKKHENNEKIEETFDIKSEYMKTKASFILRKVEQNSCLKLLIKAANKQALIALGKESIIVKVLLGEKSKEMELKVVWFVSNISRNSFSELVTQDRNPISEFSSTSTNVG